MSSFTVPQSNHELHDRDGGHDKQPGEDPSNVEEVKESAFKGLGWLDRLLALRILLAMVVGILIGNFVPDVDKTLQKGQFVGVSLPIGEYATRY